MATAKLKRKPRLSKFESYRAANIKETRFVVSPQVLCRCSWVHTRLLLFVVLGGLYVFMSASTRKILGFEGQFDLTWISAPGNEQRLPMSYELSSGGARY